MAIKKLFLTIIISNLFLANSYATSTDFNDDDMAEALKRLMASFHEENQQDYRGTQDEVYIDGCWIPKSEAVQTLDGWQLKSKGSSREFSVDNYQFASEDIQNQDREQLRLKMLNLDPFITSELYTYEDDGQITHLLNNRQHFQVKFVGKSLDLYCFNVLANGDCGLEALGWNLTRGEIVQLYKLRNEIPEDFEDRIPLSDLKYLYTPYESLSVDILMMLGCRYPMNVNVWIENDKSHQLTLINNPGFDYQLSFYRNLNTHVLFDGKGHFQRLVDKNNVRAIQAAVTNEASIPAREKKWLGSLGIFE